MIPQYPETARELLKSIYVEDILTGADNEKQALRIYSEASDIFRLASMKLHKWLSNSPRVLEEMNEGEAERVQLGDHKVSLRC